MKKKLSILAGVGLILCLLVGSSMAVNSTQENPLDSGKEILYYLFWTRDEKLEKDIADLKEELALSQEQVDELKSLGLSQHLENQSLEQTYSSNARTSVAMFNSAVDENVVLYNSQLKEILDEKYEDFRSWIANWWEEEREYRNNKIKTRADIDALSEVYATQYVPNTSGAIEVALPDKYIKWANLGWDDTYADPPYVVNIYNPETTGTILNIAVDEVGPWNENDNYWDEDRRTFSNLDVGVPEAQAAFFDGYNNGKDEFGRTVTNGAGIDLSTEAAKKIGFGTYESGWIAVRYEYLP